MSNDAINKFLAHATEVRTRMTEGQPRNQHNQRTDVDDRIDSDARALRLLAHCPTCRGQGFIEEGYAPTARTACGDCGATGRFPTSVAIGILELLKHALDPQVTEAAKPEAIERFNTEARTSYEKRVEIERAEEEKRAKMARVRDILSEADPDVLARALQAAGAEQVNAAATKARR